MSLIFKRGAEPLVGEQYLKFLLYGDSGAGKSWLAATAPNPLILLTERNGEQSVRRSNPEARYAVVSSMDDVRDVLRAAHAGSLDGSADSIVIDGLTEIQRMLKDEMMAQRGSDEFTLPMWGEMTEKIRRMLRMLRDMRMHVVCTALSETEMDGDTRYVYPAFQGRKLHSEVMQYFNAVGYVHRDKSDHLAMFDGPTRFSIKNCHPLRGSRSGPISDWVNEMLSEPAGAVVEVKAEVKAAKETTKPTKTEATDGPQS